MLEILSGLPISDLPSLAVSIDYFAVRNGGLRRIRSIVATGLVALILGSASIGSATSPPTDTWVEVTLPAHSAPATSAISVRVAVDNANSLPVGTVELISDMYSSGLISVNEPMKGRLTVIIPAGALAPGRHLLTVKFVPDPSVSDRQRTASGSSSVWVTTGPGTTTSLAITSGGSVVSEVPAGNALVLTATVRADDKPVTTGQVLFCDTDAGPCTELNSLAVTQLTNSGTAALTFHPGAGSHRYIARFKGTPNGPCSCSESSSDPVSITVSSRFPTKTTLSDALEVTLSGSGHHSPPTGTLTLRDAYNGGAVMDVLPLPKGDRWSYGTIDFNPQSELAWIAAPYTGDSLVTADFNDDGNLDLAVANETANDLRLFLGSGDGNFSLSTDLTISGGPSSLVVSDFNQDGKLDLAVANQDGSMSVLLGQGDGTLTPSAQTIAGVGSHAVVGDFNWDGIPDLAAANHGSGNLSILLGNGDGTFTSKAALPADGAPEPIVTVDYDLDGIADLITACGIYFGNGDGTFRQPGPGSMCYPPLGQTDGAIVAGNFTDSEFPNVVVARGSDVGLSGPRSGRLEIDGVTFTDLAIGHGNRYSLARGEFNRDGKPDLVLGQWNADSNSTTVLLGKGDGTFTDGYWFNAKIAKAAAGANPAFAVGDFNGDGISDIAAGNSNGGVSVLLTEITINQSISGGYFLGPKTYAAYATYSGDAFFSSSVSNVVHFTGPNRLTPMVTVTPSASVTRAALPLSISVTVSARVNPTPTGTVTVTFHNPSPRLGTLDTYTAPPALLNQGSATITIPGGTLDWGSYTITATYTPDAASSASYYSSVSGGVSETLTTPYFLYAGMIVINKGTPTSLFISAHSTEGYSSLVTLTSCTLNDGGPANSAADAPRCSITSSTMTVDGKGAVVTVTTTAPTTAMNVRPHLRGTKAVWGEGGAILALLIFLAIPVRTRSWRAMLLLFVMMIGLGSLAACGGGGGNPGGGGRTSGPGTASGLYSFKVTAIGSDTEKSAATTIFNITVN
jgi:hypothetical protein